MGLYQKGKIDQLAGESYQDVMPHTVQKLIVISNKFPRTFDSILLSYVIDAY